MTYTITRILSATVLGALVTGCATVPGDPYYDAPRYPVYEQPGYIYSAPQPVYQAPPVYRTPGVIYSAPPPAVYYGGRDRDDNRWDNDRNRGDWRERERERDRAERDRAARERERREREARDRDRERRDRCLVGRSASGHHAAGNRRLELRGNCGSDELPDRNGSIEDFSCPRGDRPATSTSAGHARW